MVDKSSRQQRLQRARSRANSRVAAASASTTLQKTAENEEPELSPGSMPVKPRMLQMQNDGNVEVVRPPSRAGGSGGNNTSSSNGMSKNSFETTQSQSTNSNRHTAASSKSQKAHVSRSSVKGPQQQQQQQTNNPARRSTPPQSRNDNNSEWFQYTNGTNMRTHSSSSSFTPKVSNKITSKIDNLIKQQQPSQQQQQQQQQSPSMKTDAAPSDFDNAWASFSDSPFDNPFATSDSSIGNGFVDWPTSDNNDDGYHQKKMKAIGTKNTNNTNRMQEKIRGEAKQSVETDVVVTATTKTVATRAVHQQLGQGYSQKKETLNVPVDHYHHHDEDEEAEFFCVESDEVTNLTSLDDTTTSSNGNDWNKKMQSDKESDIAALFKYRNGKGGGGTSVSNSAVVKNMQQQQQPSKSLQFKQTPTTTTSSQTLGTTKLKRVVAENKQQQFPSSKQETVTGNTSFLSQIKQQHHQPSTSKLTTTTSQTPTSAIIGPYGESPAKPINLDTNRFKNMPRSNSNSNKSTTIPSNNIHSTSSLSSSKGPSSSPTGYKSGVPRQRNGSQKGTSVGTASSSVPLSSLPGKASKNLVTPDSKSSTASSSPNRFGNRSAFKISSIVSPSPVVSKSSNATKKIETGKPVGSTFRKQTLPPKTYMKPSSQSRSSNPSIVIKHGGTPVWIHTSIFNEGKNIDMAGGGSTSWNWVRAYLSAATSDNTIQVTVDDSTSRDYNGKSYTISKCYNDGEKILMGNTWWTSSSTSSVDESRSSMPPEDLVELTHLHEPAIVHALEARYKEDIIYTNTGSILLAVNPFKKIDNLYTREMMELYWIHDKDVNNEASTPPPHAFAVAERAFSSMMRSLEESDSNAVSETPCNQSILVSGESGAGKTVNTKIVMRYLTLLSQRHMRKAMSPSRTDKECLSVESQVLQSNPILESFGNARTIRNDNSSRFVSKLDATTQVAVVRLVSVNPGERNYHVFYEITCPRGMGVKEKKRYKLTSNFGKGETPLGAEDFKMTSISGTFDRRDGVADLDTYQELRMAMDSVGFADHEQEGIFRVTAALLHASNLQFENRGSDDSYVYDGDGTLAAVSDLLGVSVNSLQTALTSSVIEARGEVLMKRLSTTQAKKALEAVTKAIYGVLFEYIVKRINQSIEVHGDADEYELNKVATIGVLDIFGFESFQTNSFEQLCINYCNEALQQQFAKFVFKAEQAEYEEEGIGWSNIDFPDNQDTLDLIEAKRVGIFSVLDEQCRLPKRTDQTFAKAVHDVCEKNEFYVASRMQQSNGSFSIIHYAGEVEYDSSGFLLKNKDDLPKGTFELLSSSTVELISELACILESGDDVSVASSANNSRAPMPMKRSSSTLSRPTVSGQFSSQLRVLRSRIEMTEPHYIRCLKPNDRLVADSFDHSLISHQLNCAGVLPAMKIARAGFAMRYLHNSFDQRFSPIVSKEVATLTYRRLKQAERSRKLVGLLSSKLEIEMKNRLGMGVPYDVVSWGVQIGKTKVFLRATAFEALEELRYSVLNKAAVTIQANARAFLERNRLLLRQGSILTLQCAVRRMMATIFVRRLRFHQRAISIQSQWRSYSVWFSYQNTVFITVWCQRFWRGRLVRTKVRAIKDHLRLNRKAAVEMQQVNCEPNGVIARSIKRNGAENDEKIQLLSEECKKKDRELEMLRKEVDALRENSVTQPPTTVSVSYTSRSSAFGVPFLPSDTSNIFRDTPNMPSSNLLDSEMEEKGQYNSFNLSMESSFMDNSTTLPLHWAAKSNNYKILLDEIQNASSDIEISINAVDSKGRTPLHVAVQNSNLEIAKILLSNDAIFNAQDYAGNTALHYANSPEMGLLLLEKGSSPNIPNGKGLCCLHLAVQRRDFASIRLLLSYGADANNADDECWYTPLHLIAHPESSTVKKETSLRGPIAELICEAKSPSIPDLNYQDRDGNTPLHHAASLAEEDVGILISVFIEHGACPKIANNRGQTPIHLFCHNNAARNFAFYHEALHLMLAKGANPNHQSLSGCTALHLALYHQDVEAAAMLVSYGAQLNTPWVKPVKWNSFWTEVGSDDVVLPLDMLEDVVMLHRVISEVSTPQMTAPRRQKCMHCKLKFGVFARPKHCANCGRSVCGRCAKGSLKTSHIPSLRNNIDESHNTVCIVCEHILLAQANSTPTASVVVGEGSVVAGSVISAVSF
ncbi:hypothetical protein ACHAWC_011483 [Mediolabrus comicus]